MDVYDSSILSNARTQYRNIASTIDGEIITGNGHSYLLNGKVVIVSSSKKLMEDFIQENDLVILGNRKEAQQLAIDQNVSCMVVCLEAGVSEEILEQAKEKEIVIITTPHDTFTVARLINQSIPVRYFMTKKEDLVTFKMRDYVDDVKEVMTRKRFRDFPVVDNKGNFLGFISRRRLLNCRKKQVILVDHNEKNQAVDGIEQADVLEIIDHHRLRSIETIGPVFFRNQPVGCTATIVFQMYQENGVKVTPTIAGLLCSAIISDTLMFRSPTCTPLDEMSARTLAEIAEIDIEMLAQAMFRAGSNLKDKSPEEIFYQDYKKFIAEGDICFGVGQISSMDSEELKEIKERLLPFMVSECGRHGVTRVYFMLTDIMTQSTELLFYGEGSREMAENAFKMEPENDAFYLEGVVSRKKQLIPPLMEAAQMSGDYA